MLKAARVKLGYSTGDMANEINKCRSSYIKKENGDVVFTDQEIFLVSQKLLLTMEDVNDIFFDSKLPFRNNMRMILPSESIISRIGSE
ncbi:hypothetical protein SDC9_162128 [bioreactor metagenome]|uniref:HTH cro/C1-type domain-containing protein n=1 Tax=bioreactor metagenome TaxID=1076179 RepID=A0A645FN86_9ZZZZ